MNFKSNGFAGVIALERLSVGGLRKIKLMQAKLTAHSIFVLIEPNQPVFFELERFSMTIRFSRYSVKINF
jgi:hypothetical protein